MDSGAKCDPRILVDGCIVRIIADPALKLDVPRRQGFAWARNAEAYAQELAIERGWKLERVRG